ncbi:hypothetical protein [Pseudomonas fluorescens]|uniref:Uncharacterized protein n=1 Tax=Pseudomonas fluorescens TaxID=294 RepID=A0A0F4T1B7_PSEFL|nr:hypothetical protein [Pseudomonas fluorescens]KJZ37202.1 hypothetical protein VC34_26265 [Pseudomonas fluorescens]
MSAVILQFPPRLGFGQRVQQFAATGTACNTRDYGCAATMSFDFRGVADYLERTSHLYRSALALLGDR